METEKLQKQIDILESRIEHLEACHRDLAVEYLDNLVKRIEAIRQETLSRIQESDCIFSEALQKAFEKVSCAVKEARQNLRAELISTDVISALTDGSHVLVTRPASRAEQQTGQAVPVKQVR